MDRNSIKSMNRREFVEKLSALGISAGVLSTMTPDAFADLVDDPRKEVPRLIKRDITNKDSIISDGVPPEFEPDYEIISRREWKRIEGPKKLAQNLENMIRSRFDNTVGTVSVGTKSDPNDVGLMIDVRHKIRKSDRVEEHSGEVSTFDNIKQQIPTETGVRISSGKNEWQVDNIKVDFSEVKSDKDDHDICNVPPDNCEFNHNYDGIPGGVDGGDGGTGCGCTLGVPGYSEYHSKYVITMAAHCVDDQSGIYINQPNDGGVFGRTEKVLKRTSNPPGEGDVAVVQPMDGYDASVTMALADGDGGYEFGISGIITEVGIDHILSNDDQVMMQGRRTGRNFAELNRVWNDNGTLQIEYNIGTGGGDSGAPVVYPGDNNNCWVVASHHQHNCDVSDSTLRGQGTAIDSVKDDLYLKYSSENSL